MEDKSSDAGKAFISARILIERVDFSDIITASTSLINDQNQGEWDLNE